MLKNHIQQGKERKLTEYPRPKTGHFHIYNYDSYISDEEK